MKPSELLDVHPLLFDRVRLSIMAHLSLNKASVDFNALIEALDLTKGNLSTHMGKFQPFPADSDAQTAYVEIDVTVHIVSGKVAATVRNGVSQTRYHG